MLNPFRSKRLNSVLLPIFLLIGALGSQRAIAQSATQILQATGIESGVCLVLGTHQAALDLQNAGKMLVQVLTTKENEAAEIRNQAMEKGLAGLVSSDVASSLQKLPFAENLVNLLVADLDALGNEAPPNVEILRVLVPEGVAYLKENGQWKQTRKPMPNSLDDWSHFSHGADGNAVSKDEKVAPGTAIQWIANQKSSFQRSNGLRAAGGRVFYEWPYEVKVGTKTEKQQYLDSRDAFNGVALWRKKTDPGNRLKWMVAQDDMVYLIQEREGELVGMDSKTGEVKVRFPDAGKSDQPVAQIKNWAAVSGDQIIYTNKNTVYGMNRHNGSLIWKYQDQDNVFFPTVSEDLGMVFFAASPWTMREDRWPGVMELREVIGFDLKAKKVAWKAPFKNKAVTQLVYGEGYVTVYKPDGIGGIGDCCKSKSNLMSIRATDGAIMWQHDSDSGSPDWGGVSFRGFGVSTGSQNTMIRDGKVYVMGTSRWRGFDLKSGIMVDESPKHSIGLKSSGSLGSGCQRNVWTANFKILGETTYIKKDLSWTNQGISRSGCATGAYPAYGMTYYAANECNCYAMVRGHVAIASEALPAAVPDASRLKKTYPISTAIQSPKALSLSTPLIDDWSMQDYYPAKETEVLATGGLKITGIVHEHRLEARDGANKLVWHFTSGGRISSAPIVVADNLFFGSTDGYVYSLKVKDGSFRWRFMAAPAERKIVAFSQLESTWPVFNVALYDGKIYATAGWHPQAGGLHLWALDPEQGKIEWKATYFDPSKMQDGSKSSTSISERQNLVNANPMQIQNGKLAFSYNRVSYRGSSAQSYTILEPSGEGWVNMLSVLKRNTLLNNLNMPL